MFIIKTIFLCLLVSKCVLAAPSTLLPETAENTETNTAATIDQINSLETQPTTILDTPTDGESEEIEIMKTPTASYIELIENSPSSEESNEASPDSDEPELDNSAETIHSRFARHIGYGVGVIGIGGGFGGFSGYRPYYPRSYGGYGYGYGYGRPWGNHHHYPSPYYF